MAKLRLKILLLCLPALVLVSCSSTTRQGVIGILSAESVQQSQSGSPALAAEQNSGYGQAEAAKDNILKLDYFLENDPQNDLQVLVRNLVQDSQSPVVAIVGATTNEATMQAAGLVNFFNVPMLIPTADGQTIFPSNNLWAFRLSAPSSAHAGYFFREVLNKTNFGGADNGAGLWTGVNLAILYEQNTFGESAAVATANAAMAQEIRIAEYKNFPAENPSTEQLSKLAEAVEAQHPALVYLIASKPETARALVKNLRSRYATDDVTMPIVVGQSGAFTSEIFLSSPEAQDVYILRQHWNKDRCPPELNSFYEAQAYSAAYLLNYTVGLTTEALPVNRSWFSRTDPAVELAKFRETLRDKLKETNLNVPCLGKVAFDNTGQNKLLEFELLSMKNSSASIVSTADFIQALVDVLKEMNASFD